ncbi:hypothetical protein [Erwinia sp.]|uniref:hypothetical protein n=1 Tax=Erwinia citreus TaxID=558 RepID=UPI003C74C8DA
MDISRRMFYRLAFGSAAGLAVLRHMSVARAKSLNIPLRNGAGDKGETMGGMPPAGAVCSVANFDYQLKYQRAFEAVLWNMPAVAIYSFGVQPSAISG